MTIKIISIVLMITLMFSSTCLAEEFVIGMSEAFKPYNYIENHKWIGIDVEIANEAFKRLGVKVEYREFPWARVLKMAETGDIDGVLSVYCNDKRPFLENTYEQSYSVKISFFSQKRKHAKITGIHDFDGTSVGVNRGNYYAKYIDTYTGIEKFESIDVKMLLRPLNANRIDFALHEVGPFLYYSKELGFEGRFEAVYDLKQDSVCMAFSKAALGTQSKMWSDKVSKIVLQLKDEGFIQKVVDTYLPK